MAENLEGRSKSYLIFLVLTMGLVALIDQYLNLIETTAIPYIVEEFWFTPRWIQTLKASMGLGMASVGQFAYWQGIYGIITFTVFLINWSADAIGRKKGVLILLLFMGIPALIIGLSPHANPLTPAAADPAFHFFMVFYAIVIMASLSNIWEVPITEEAPPKKRAMLGTVAYFIGLIPLYAFFGFIAEAWGWRWLYGVMFFFMIGAIILWSFTRETERWQKEHEKRGGEFITFKACIEKMTRIDLIYVIIAGVVYTVWNIGLKLGTVGAGTFFMIVKGVSLKTWNSIFAIAGLMTIIGAIISGVLMDKIGRNKTLTLGTLLSFSMFCLLGLIGHPVFLWLLFFSMSMLLAWIMVYFSEIFPTEYRSTCIGITNTVSRVGYVLGPLLASLLIMAFPTMEMYWILGGLIILVFLLAVLMNPLETKHKTLEEIEQQR
ncbi:MAG: MFS transporter [Candidatus Helarchaeota archaeon]